MKTKHVWSLALRTAAASCALAFSSTAHATSIADSQIDFSGVQGQGGWYYGFYEGTLNPSGFQQLPLYGVFAAGMWSRSANAPGGYWTFINNVGGHPNGIQGASGRVAVINWAVRRFVFAAGGNVVVTGQLKKAQACGGGVIGHIFVNGAEVWTQTIQGNDLVGVTYSLQLCLPPGSIIDWAIDPRIGEETCDSSVFTATLVADNSAPCPGDFTCDGEVDDDDFAAFDLAYNLFDCADSAMPPGCPADLNNDGFVDDADFVLFALAYDALICP
ncbi:MAG: hypothetical protein JNM86_14125 [Phycisphaerae bacterium]|nr:hypothetical protein [Phycisphaerae bacterium]